MGVKNSMELLKGVVESRQESIMEEFTKMLVQGEFNGEDAINLYFSKDVEPGIKFAIIGFTNRNTLLDIYMKEDDENYTKSIRWRLKELYPDEVKMILFSDDKDIHKKDAFFFAINFVDAKTILEYLKLHPDLDSFYLSEFLGRLLKVEISQDVADEILLLDICSDFEKSVVDHLILKASTLTLIKCLSEKRDYFVEEQLKKMEEIFLNSTITEETAEIINKAKAEGAELIVASMHWGVEYQTTQTYFGLLMRILSGNTILPEKAIKHIH